MRETATEKIIRLLLVHPKHEWKQAELARRARCSKAFLSKLAKRWASEGIVARPRPQALVLISASRLLVLWSAIRRLPKPVYVATKLPTPRMLDLLKKDGQYAVTGFFAAWLRTKYMRTNRLEVYVPRSSASAMIRRIGAVSKAATPIMIFPAGREIFDGAETLDGVTLVHVAQNYVDLAAMGGTGIRVGAVLARKYGLLGA